jgi:spermidine synthase
MNTHSSTPTNAGPASNSFKWLFALAFTLSGFAALAYQIAWQRVLTQVIGSDAISAVLVVAVFMVWLGVGSEIARRLLPRVGNRAGEAYAVLETIIGIAGIASIPALRSANAWLAAAGGDWLVADVMLNLLLLAIPVIGMGMTTPLIVEVAKNQLSDLGRTVGRFYGLNILGAAVGALLTGLVLIELIGLSGVTILAACLNIGVGISVIMALKGREAMQPASSEAGRAQRMAAKATLSIPIAARYRLAAVMFGFGTLALQIVFFRVLSNYFTMSVIVFPAVLCAYLLLMSAGQIVGGRLADRFPGKLETVVAGLFAAGALTLLAALRFPPEWAARIGALAFTDFNGQLIRDLYPALIGDPVPHVVLLFSGMFMLAVLLWSALFPVMLRLVTRDISEAGAQFAGLYSLYTLGNVAGAFVTGLVFFEWLGTGRTAAATIAITAVGALLVVLPSVTAERRRAAIAAGLAGIISVALMPWDYYRSFGIGRYQIASVYEGRTGVASVAPTGRFYTIVDMNRTASASALVSDPAPADEYEAWRWNHTELLALDPAFRPKRVLVIGIGHAYIVDALLDLPSIEKITVVDLSKEIVDAVKANTLNGTKRIFNDPRVDIQIADGRRFVQKALARGERYDLIQTKINEPWHAGSGNLFTIEFFRAQRQLLTPNGYLGVRPLVGHVVDGLKVFDNVIWPGYYHMFFKNGTFEKPSIARVTPELRDAWHSMLPGRPETKGPRDNHLKVVVFPCCDLGTGVRHNTDDLPSFEYDWLARTFGRWVSPRTNLWYLKLPQENIPVVVE